MNARIVQPPLSRLEDYAGIPIRFEVQTVFEVEGDDPATARLVEVPVDPPWIKDYDAIPGEGPTRWARRWDLSHWGMLVARIDDAWVGGAVLAHNTDGVHELEGRDDIVVLWDLRVHPDHRGRGTGRMLFDAAVGWARERRCRELRVETQNINVPACRFYRRQGCRLFAVRRDAYPLCPGEVELIWTFELSDRRRDGGRP